jgi:hypothetical protein
MSQRKTFGRAETVMVQNTYLTGSVLQIQSGTATKSQQTCYGQRIVTLTKLVACSTYK